MLSKGTLRAISARRRGLGPFLGSATVGVAAEISYVTSQHYEYSTIETGAMLAAGAIALGTHAKTTIGDSLHRLYRYGVYGVSSLYILGVQEFGHSVWQLPALLIGASAAGVPWWTDRVRASAVRVEQAVQRWPRASHRLGMTEVSLTDVRVDALGNYNMRMIWPAGAHTVRNVLARKEDIEGALDLPTGSLSLERDGTNSNSIRAYATLKDPHSETIPWIIPTEEIGGELYLKESSVLDPITLGMRNNGTTATLRMFVKDWGSRHLLAAGAKGSGKSGFLTLKVCEYACKYDVVQWGVDLKGGMELGPLAGVFDWVVCTLDRALLMVRALEAVIDARADYCRRKGWKKWQPDRQHPVLAVTIDECSGLNGRMGLKDLERLVMVAEKGRAVGVELNEATQFPTVESLGTTRIREQMDQRLCFRLNSSAGEHVIFEGEKAVGADAIPADRPGTCYHKDNEVLDRLSIRVLLPSEEEVSKVVELRTGYTTPLDEMTTSAVLAAVPEYRDRALPEEGLSRETGPVPGERDSGGTERDPAEVPPWYDGPDLPLHAVVESRNGTLSPEQRERESRERDFQRERESRPRLSEADAMAALEQALRDSGPDGIRAKDLAEIATRRSSWLYETGLARLKQDGKVRRTRNGFWAWAEEREPAHAG